MTNFDINKRFQFLENMTMMVINEVTPSLILVGEGGLGKSYSVTNTVAECGLEPHDYVVIKGYSTARGLYNTLFDNNGKLIIFDDCDSILEDKTALNILKSALDSYDKRTISWMTKMTKNDDYPQQFDFTGRIIFISNKNKQSIDGAILSRSLTVDLSMTADEKIERMSYILPQMLPEYSKEVKQQALQFLSENKSTKNLNLRTLIMVIKMCESCPSSWRDMATYMMMN